ncbi:germin-like protein subfamily 1 member 13 [Punica granatum]|uniref:Germin-like protein n=2 Tax=Punica granatum TaxID=22663 RepID=A0A6P8C997_PUNGR|nr:germin-like protein subfamily 1 member 13 [Punica granatum]
MKLFVILYLCSLVISSSFAFDPSPLQDICVATAEPKNAVFVNGKFCKNPNLTVADDFLFRGINIPRSTNNNVRSTVTMVAVDQLPGLNTLGISLARIDYAPYGGLNPPHIHPRATEVIMCVQGELYVGFVLSNQLGNRLITKVLKPGDVFVFPFAMIHFQLNIGKTAAVAISSLSSQNPGVITIANAVFGSNPPINVDVLTKAFQVDKKVINDLQSQFSNATHN